MPVDIPKHPGTYPIWMPEAVRAMLAAGPRVRVQVLELRTEKVAGQQRRFRAFRKALRQWPRACNGLGEQVIASGLDFIIERMPSERAHHSLLVGRAVPPAEVTTDEAITTLTKELLKHGRGQQY